VQLAGRADVGVGGLDPNDFDALRDAYPGGEDVDVRGAPGYRFGSAADGFGTFTLLVPMGRATLMLTVSSSDPALATDALSLQLAEAALAGGASGSSGSGQATPGSAAATPETSFCAHLTSEDVSAAIGIEVQLLPNQTIPWSCGWVGGDVAVEINQLDAATIEGLAADFGGVAVEGLPFQAWWASEHDLLHVLSGDVAFHVFMASDDMLDEADARTRAIALAEVFLASRGGG
jgi:hypothetical protein